MPTGPTLCGPLVMYHHGTGAPSSGYAGCLIYLSKLKKFLKLTRILDFRTKSAFMNDLILFSYFINEETD